MYWKFSVSNETIYQFVVLQSLQSSYILTLFGPKNKFLIKRAEKLIILKNKFAQFAIYLHLHFVAAASAAAAAVAAFVFILVAVVVVGYFA